MSDAKTLLSSDLDAFKEGTGVLSASLTFSGTLAAGGEIALTSDAIAIDNLDYSQVLFDNSAKHPGRYRNLSLENATMIHENTSNSELQSNVYIIVNGSSIQFGAQVFNPYSTAVALQTTTINFLYIPYQATI